MTYYNEIWEIGYMSGGLVALVELILWYVSHRSRSMKWQWGCMVVMFVLAMLYTLIRLWALLFGGVI